MIRDKKSIRVVASIIIKEERIFAAKRDYGPLKGKWEFPGGKIDRDETPESALVREIREELNSLVSIDRFYMNVQHEYEDFHLDMDVYISHLIEGNLLHENGIHSEENFFSLTELSSLEWCPADKKIVDRLLSVGL